MHGAMGKPPAAAKDDNGATSRVMLLLLVAMTGVAPISLYLLVPALPQLATAFSRDISIAQMTVSLYMVGIACSQIIMGPLSDRFGRRPVLLAGLTLMVMASVACIFAQTLPQLIAARFLQALGGATGMVVSRAIIRDLYSRERIGAMTSLVIAVMMIAQMLSPLTGGLIETAFGWRAIFYLITAASLVIAVAIALMLPETRRDRVEAGGFRGDVGSLITSRAFVGYMLCQVLASQIIFTFAGGGPYIVVTQMGRSGAEYGAWFAATGFAYLIGNLFCVRYAPRHSLEKSDLVRTGAAVCRQPVEPDLGHRRPQHGAVVAVRHPDAGDVRQRLRDVELGGRRDQRPPRGRRHGVRHDGFPADGDRLAVLAIRRLPRRQFRNAGGAQRGHRRSIGRLRIDHDLPRPAADPAGQRGTDRTGGGGRVGAVVGGGARRRPNNSVIARHSRSKNGVASARL
jgi:Bcr/CflA subfamily drug resistance transporter